MKQEDKELLLVNLCARVPYGVKGVITYDKDKTLFTVEGFDNNVLHLSDAEECYVEDFKSYLRPMSSMTEEEANYMLYTLINDRDSTKPVIEECILHGQWNARLIDWLNKKMFAYRTIDGKDMFELGLALKAPEGMYK